MFTKNWRGQIRGKWNSVVLMELCYFHVLRQDKWNSNTKIDRNRSALLAKALLRGQLSRCRLFPTDFLLFFILFIFIFRLLDKVSPVRLYFREVLQLFDPLHFRPTTSQVRLHAEEKKGKIRIVKSARIIR